MSKIAIIHPWDRAKWSEPLMWDGLHAALKLVGEKHQVDWFLQGDEPDDSYDWIMPWGVGSLPFNDTIERFSGRKALICAGHPQDTKNMEKFDAVFVESPAVYRELLPFCKRVEIAFGTDTDFFYPDPISYYCNVCRVGRDKRIFDVFYPATFSDNWKRQQLFAEASRGYKAMACGLLQPDGVEGYKKCIENGVYVMEGLIPTRLIAELYRQSRVCVITSWHGSERSALEALSSNLPLVITRDNDLTCSLVGEKAIVVDPTPEDIKRGIEIALSETVTDNRSWVLDNYSHHKYAEKLLEVIES